MKLAPFHPIIYVRGYAMSKGEQNETTADPFCGFNLGSTVYRATTAKTKRADKYIFESPVVRLMSDHCYSDVYRNGLDIVDEKWEGEIPYRSIIIYRYYDESSELLDDGKNRSMETFAKGLNDLILKVRSMTYWAEKTNGMETRYKVEENDFRCYLVAHSMGGLVCRAFLQNPALGSEVARRCVDKVFTYATPHNGIDMAGLNVPPWLTKFAIANFNRKRMAEYLNFADSTQEEVTGTADPVLKKKYKETGRVDWLPEWTLPLFHRASERFFCMVATNRGDYEVANGLSRTFAGHGSDGLVRVANASVWGVANDGKTSAPCATAYAYRAHSGWFGIVNGEESYQNLQRFLFGDMRVDIWLDVESVRLPAALEGRAVDGLYQFEIKASPKGKLWNLTRRIAEEDSVACRSHVELTDPNNPQARNVYLSTVFLSQRERINENSESLTYGLTLGIRVPDYTLDRKMWLDEHFDGRDLFRESLTVSATAPKTDSDNWKVLYDWGKTNMGVPKKRLKVEMTTDGKWQMVIPFEAPTAPGIKGQLRFLISEWNR